MTSNTPRDRARRATFAALGRLAVATVVIASTVVAVAVVAVLGRPPTAPVAGPPAEPEIEPAPVPPGSAAPPGLERLPEVPEVPEQGAADPIREWADEVANAVDVPARALVAYANADLAMRDYQPDCKISWATLAGIGRVESNHGRYGDRVLGENARPSSPIIGVPLDGGPGVAAIPDTDGGALDGDALHDRAVGPMQFIPTTWQKWSSDGNGDGVGDPHNLDDAAVAAGRYLCSGARDMTTGEGWWGGLFSYNRSVEYGQKVFALAETYADAGNRRS